VASDFRFKRLFKTHGATVTMQFEDRSLQAFEGETVATALLASGIDFTRTTPVSGSARAPFCMMGTCFECLMEIDQVPNRQACMVQVADGMVIRRMHGARNVDQGE